MKNEPCTLINESWVLAGGMHTIKRMVLLAVCLLVLGSTQPLLADITNGYFNYDLSVGWDVSNDSLVYKSAGWAVLTLDYEEVSPYSTLSQDGIYLDPDSDKWLSFDFVMDKGGWSGPEGDETDEFTATFGPSETSPSPFYTLRSSDFVDDWYQETVTFPLIDLDTGPSHEYKLLFKLINVHPDATATSVFIDNVRLSAVPVPGAVLLGSIGLSFSGWVLRRRRASH